MVVPRKADAANLGYFVLTGKGGYITAWAVSLLGAVVLLYVMSIPRRVVVGDTALEIRCIVEITHIKYADLRSIRRDSSRPPRRFR